VLSNFFSCIISRNFPLHYISKSVNHFFLHAHFSQCNLYSLLSEKMYFFLSRVREGRWLVRLVNLKSWSKKSFVWVQCFLVCSLRSTVPVLSVKEFVPDACLSRNITPEISFIDLLIQFSLTKWDWITLVSIQFCQRKLELAGLRIERVALVETSSESWQSHQVPVISSGAFFVCWGDYCIFTALEQNPLQKYEYLSQRIAVRIKGIVSRDGGWGKALEW
jgi:hypothetical protein